MESNRNRGAAARPGNLGISRRQMPILACHHLKWPTYPHVLIPEEKKTVEDELIPLVMMVDGG